MAQKYYVDNLISKFIKCLLWDTYIPTVDIWKPGKSLVKGFTYITYDKYIVVAKKDYPSSNPLDKEPKSALDQSYFTIIDKYIEGKFYKGLTTNFESNSALYDPDTHYMLGQYLRSIRDLHDLDLMPYYNCYSGISSDKLRINKIITKDTTIQDKYNISYNLVTDNTVNDGLVSYIVPIKMNQDYTIYYNTSIPFQILPIYYDNISAQEITNQKAIVVNGCSVLKPFKYKFDAKGNNDVFQDTRARLVEDYLCLLIQVPKNTDSNLVVLEGDYTNVKLNLNNTNNEASGYKLPKVFLGDIDNIDLNTILKPFPSLVLLQGDTNFAFSDRLIEYLLYNPIINNDRIKSNISRIQKYLSSNKAQEELGSKYTRTFIKDIWDNNLRYYIYNLVTQNNKTRLFKDINGFVDKDTEFIIDKAKIKEGDWNV